MVMLTQTTRSWVPRFHAIFNWVCYSLNHLSISILFGKYTCVPLNPWLPLQTSHINFRYFSWNDLWEENFRVSCQWTENYITMAGVTKATVMKSIRDNFNLSKCEVNHLNHIYLTGTATAKLWQPLSNMNEVFPTMWVTTISIIL